jgi:hypothetical protein
MRSAYIYNLKGEKISKTSMTYSEHLFPSISYRSHLVHVLRAEDHPLQPVEGASTYVVRGFVLDDDVRVFVKDVFGLKGLG